MPDSQRLVMEMLRWASAAGAAALNYVEARELLRDARGRTAGVAATDVETGERFELRAPVVVNCAGPWSREVAARLDRDLPELFRPSVALNLLLDRPAPSTAALALAPPGRGDRTYFLHPWKGRLFAGTYHAPWDGGPDRPLDARLVSRFLEDLSRALPGAGLGERDVLRVTWGLLPARRAGTAELAVREILRHHGDDGGPEGLYSVSGVKFTTARRVAEKVLRRVLAPSGRALPLPSLAARPAPAGWPDAERLEQLLERDPAAAGALVVRLAREESARHLDDLMLRRTDWGADPARGRRLAGRVAALTGWDEARRRLEVAVLERAIG
jgi:glycerol-3-phosphate dehydrogenase